MGKRGLPTIAAIIAALVASSAAPIPTFATDPGAFFTSIQAHLNKSNDFTVVDVSGFAPEHAAAVDALLSGLPDSVQSQIVRLGF